MLFCYPNLSAQDWEVIDQINKMREQLGHNVQNTPRKWTGLLARTTHAQALRASNSVEGIHVSFDDALAAVDNEDPAEADRQTYQSVLGYRSAMNYILQRCQLPGFRFSTEMLFAVHYMICEHNLDANPGQPRPGWVGVRNAETGELVHEGVDRDSLEPLLDELVTYLNTPNGEPVIVRGAMAHLNLAMLHPFSDGNGRVARCMQTAVLASDGTVNPVFSSIEEYVGEHLQEYYDVLATTGGGGWNPERSCAAWIRFCITAHHRQVRRLINRNIGIERLCAELETVIKRHRLYDRTLLALAQVAIFGRIRNSAYRKSAEISNNLASRDLKALVDAGLLKSEGERRGRYYVPSDQIRELRQRTRVPNIANDPYDVLGLPFPAPARP